MTVREVHADQIAATVRELCMEICYRVPPEMVELMRRAREREESPIGRQILDRLLENQEIGAEGEYPYCQDTGFTVVFADLGQDVHVVGGDLYAAIDRGVATGYADGYLRGSIVRHPLFERRNTGDNTPAFVHTRIVPGGQIRIQVDAKGAGSENMGRHAMLKPADGIEGVKAFVLRAVEESGPNACPPGIIGIGVGGNFEMSAVLAKRALMRKVGQPSEDPRIAELEAELFERCNALGLGPGALGGTQTVLAVHVETMATHIASLPVAVNIECHAHRTGTRVI
ncbi:MAG TPA: fumarate hydratase [Actinobacteria bacterium]|nr:fumarate hydratase [Actinomycetota bacterium]HCP62190.1 fumarate hydratase [Actinomycetota bacterium]